MGTGSGSGSSAIASSAAILGKACAPSSDQPAISRMLTNFSSVTDSPASSAKSGASWVQATVQSAAPSEPVKPLVSLRHRSV